MENIYIYNYFYLKNPINNRLIGGYQLDLWKPTFMHNQLLLPLKYW